MTSNQKIFSLSCTAALLFVSVAFAQRPGREPRPGPPPAPARVYMNVSGTIAQLNYNRDALPEGFLLNDKTLVHFPPQVAALISSSFKPGDNVEIAGFVNNCPSGLKTVEAQQMRDRTSGKTFSAPQPGPPAPYSGSGRIQQLNYTPDGAVNGFMLDNGTFAMLPPFAATNPSSIRAGAPVTFTGYARTTVTARTVVDLQTITVDGQSITLTRVGPGNDAPPPPPPTAAATSGPGSPSAPPPPDGRRDQPPPPPPPPAGLPQ
jgi:hypothetical protein